MSCRNFFTNVNLHTTLPAKHTSPPQNTQAPLQHFAEGGLVFLYGQQLSLFGAYLTEWSQPWVSGTMPALRSSKYSFIFWATWRFSRAGRVNSSPW